MKKSQSIFLLSGLVPLVAAPIAIVASCSSDSTATTFSLKTNVSLTGLTDDQKDPSQYAGAGNKKKLADLIVAKKDQIFNNPPADLKAEQIQITNDVTANTNDGSLTFKLKVVSTANPPADLIAETDVTLKGFTATQTSDTPEQTLINTAIAEIEKAHADKTFKLKANKQTIPQNEIDALKSNPENFLTQYTDGLPQLDNALTTTVKKGNFSVADKATGSKQQQADKQQTITFKVTVSHSTAKLESDTKDLTFDFTLQTPPAAVNQETQVNAEIAVATLGLTPAAPTKDQIKQSVNAAKILEKKAVIFSQGADLITAAADIKDITWTDVTGDNTKIVLNFKVAANKWYDNGGQVGTADKDLNLTITGLTQ